MKTILTISIMAILATGVIAPALQQAYALKASDEKLSPKSFGDKTKYKITLDKSQTQKSGFEALKKEQAKTMKKINAELNAKQLLKNIYRLG